MGVHSQAWFYFQVWDTKGRAFLVWKWHIPEHFKYKMCATTGFKQRCDEVRIRIQRRLNFKCFQQIQSLTNVLSTLLLNANS